MEYPEVSIIILNWNGIEDTIECIESLKNINYQEYKIIVVDNGSSENEGQVLKAKFGDYIDIIRNERNYGYAEGNNIGIRYVLNKSMPEYILLLNNDTVVHPRFLNELIDIAEQDSATGVAGPKTYYYDNAMELQFVATKVNLWTGWINHIGVGEIDSGQYNTIRDTDYCQGSCFLIKQEVIQTIGLLDSAYFAYWEETDYCRRAHKAGFRIVYCPDAQIWHKTPQTGYEANAIYYLTRNRFLFMRKHAGKLQILTFLLYYFSFRFILFTGHFLVRRKSLKSFKSFLRGVKDGVQLLFTGT